MKDKRNKKGLVLFLLLIVPLCSFADTVPVGDAEKAATNFFRSYMPVTKSPQGRAGLVWETDEFYVYDNSNDGFVIISGDDAVNPVLAYSATGHFVTEGMPDNIRWWLGAVSEYIGDARRKHLQADLETESRWNTLLNPTKGEDGQYGVVVQLETALWSQSKPYNSKCPKVDGQRTVAGCVPIAGAIVMRYHNWPFAGKGTLPEHMFTSDNYTNITIEARELGYPYDWDNMPLDKPDTDQEIEAVATLVSDLGLMCKCIYTTEGTSAYTTDLYYGLVSYMQYSEDARLIYRQTANDDKWTETLQEELREVGPVLYSGYGDDGGHQFVLDGYDTNGMFHVNWGWGGADNCFATLEMKPASYSSFNKGQDAITGLEPITCLDPGAIQLTSSPVSDVGYFDYDHTFFVSVNVVNKAGGLYSGKFAIGLCDASGELKKIVSEETPVKEQDLTGGGTFNIACRFSASEAEQGDRLVFLCKNAGQKEWETVKGTSAKTTNSITLDNFGSIDSFTSVSYDNESKILTVTTREDVAWTLKDSSGSSEAESADFSSGVLTIDSNKLKKGIHTLTLVYEKQKKEMKINMGEQADE